MSITQNLVYKVDLANGTPVVNLAQPLVVGDQDAHKFIVNLTDKGYKADLGNVSCRAYFVRKKQGVYEAETILLPGTVNAESASVTLDASCYSRSAYFSLFVKLSDNVTGEIRTVLIVRGTVIISQDGNVLDPEDVVLSLDELLAQISAMEQATTEANEATATANEAAASVEAFKGEIQGDITALTEEIDYLASGSGYVPAARFTVGAGKEHSSYQNQIPLSRKQGETYYVTVESNNADAVITLYEYNGATGASVKTIAANTRYKLSASGDFDLLGVYIAPVTKDSDFVFRVEPGEVLNLENFETYKAETNAALNELVHIVRDVEGGSWENGIQVGEKLRLRSKYYYKVKTGSVVSFVPNGLYINTYVYPNELSGENQQPIENSGWIGGSNDVKYTIQNSGYAVMTFANGEHYGVSTTISAEDYTAETVILNYMANVLAEEDEESVLPSYWAEHAAEKIAEVNSNSAACALHGDNFVFFTDYHIEQNSGYSHLLMREIVDRTSVKKIIFGGDVFNGSETKDGALEKMNEFLRRFGPLSVYGIRGNHEYNWNDGGSVDVQLTDSEMYNALLKNVESSVVTNGALSCYFDNDNRKMRYILIDSHYENNTDVIPDSELDWIKSRLTELEAGWTAVVLTHIIYDGLYEAVQSGSAPTYSPNGERIVTAINSVKDDMSATLACVVCGHAHFDYSNTDNGYLIIATTCDSRQDSGQWEGWGEGQGTITEHAFDVFSIDTNEGTIKAVRFGRGENREWAY